MAIETRYLGDGAYVEVNPLGELVIYGINRQNEVVCERLPAMLLAKFIEAHASDLIG